MTGWCRQRSSTVRAIALGTTASLVLVLPECTRHTQSNKVQFEFDAIDSDGRPRPCLIVINDDFMGAAEGRHLVNVESDDSFVTELEFTSREVSVTLCPLHVVGGKVAKFPRSARESWDTGFRHDTRTIRADDPTRVLFVLARSNN